MSKRKFAIRDFTVITRKDHDVMNINCRHYLATMYNDYSVMVDNKTYSNKEFNKLYTGNII